MRTNKKKQVRNVSSGIRFSAGQLRIVESTTEKHLFCTGPVGSGKTETLIHRALFWAGAKKLPSDKYCLLVPSEVAGNFIRLNHDLPPASVITFEEWCRRYYENHISKDLPRTYINLKLDHREIRTKILQELQRGANSVEKLGFVFADDGQDLAPEAFEILLRVADHLTVFADFQQKIKKNSTSEEFIASQVGVSRPTRLPWRFHRNASIILRLASCFINELQTRHAFLDRISDETGQEERPQCYVAPSLEEEMNLMAETVKLRLEKGERIGIILPDSRVLHRMTRELFRRNLHVEILLEPDAQNLFHDSYDFSGRHPKMATYLTAKGMTFDSVFLPQLTRDNYGGFDEDIKARMLFLGVSRAEKWVYLSSVQGNEPEIFTALNTAQSEGSLTIF